MVTSPHNPQPTWLEGRSWMGHAFPILVAGVYRPIQSFQEDYVCGTLATLSCIEMSSRPSNLWKWICRYFWTFPYKNDNGMLELHAVEGCPLFNSTRIVMQLYLGFQTIESLMRTCTAYNVQMERSLKTISFKLLIRETTYLEFCGLVKVSGVMSM